MWRSAAGDRPLDLFGRGFVLLRFGKDAEGEAAFEAAASSRAMPLETVALDNDEAAAIYRRRLVLVRPDGHVAWRADAAPADVGAILDRVRGAA